MIGRREFITLLGGAAGWPLAAHAQRPAMPVIGYLSPGSRDSDTVRLAAVRRGLNETGYIEGENLEIEERWAQGQYDRLPALAADLVRRQVAVIVTVGTPPTIAAKAETSSIPIIFNLGIDPVAAGLVESLNRPGRNLTGVALLSVELIAKRVELIHELAPSTSVATLVNPTNAVTEPELELAQSAARSLGVDFHFLRVNTASEIDAAFERLVELRAGALVVSVDPFFTNQRSQIIALAARHRVPTIYGWREFPVSGGLISYGTSLADSYRQAGVYAGKILKGAKPADLPVQQVVKIELVVNLRTAKALGLTVPLIMQMTADEVIE